jgi:hypothetical protein
LDYLTHLYDHGFSWSTIGNHRSTLSMTMAPIDGAKVGDRPLVKRLMSGVFNERPSRRANPALWDPLKVLNVFQHWPVSLPFSSLIRKGAFLMALTTAKRPSELVALLCNVNHFGGKVTTFVLSLLVSPRLTVQVILPLPSTSSLGRKICVSVRWRQYDSFC